MAMPRWRGLHHFSGGILLVDFTDGSKYQDLSKILVFAACNAMNVDQSTAGYMLLGLIRKYIECDMYLGLEVQTEDTLQKLDQAIVNFGDALESFRDLYDNLRPDKEKAKSWDFPKMHAQKHGVPDIKAKGVIQHMSTRLSEKVHGPIRKWVVTKIDHLFLCSSAIRHRLDDWAEILKEFEDSKMFVSPSTRELFQFDSRYLGAREKPVSCRSLEARPDEAFKNFRARLLRTLKAIYTGRGSAVVPALDADALSIVECRLVEVDYESVITWRAAKDLLRCSPSFYNEPRYDSIMFHDFENTTALAQLVFPFVVQLDSGEREPMLLIQPTTEEKRRDMDRDLGLYPYLMKTRDKCRIIPLISLIRGAVLYKDASRTSHYFAVDTLDSDMFIRMKSVFRKE
ncbi:hypothetical protein PsYK624_011780 [Phanerochaete sordida]|uniref:Uncharacterized protein n=1 Tax=Phanerochaete sordida TaxID=48140 RepID=A0A9P3FYT6_9APHY|nr:hypothetical protein PsYK624_011780 [Phanerochaete sordida]